MTDNTEDESSSFLQIPPDAATNELAPGPDDLSDKEAQQLTRNLSSEDLKREAEKSEHYRSEDFKNHFGFITVAALYVMAFGVFIFAATWVWHIVTPRCWHWLEDSQLSKIQNIFTGGILAGLIADQFRKRMS
ncbi:MAG: hypothetical protein R3C00_07305 [Hyphomonas sp.]|nr:hypothetical protein [Hyphomonas sp.]